MYKTYTWALQQNTHVSKGIQSNEGRIDTYKFKQWRVHS